MVDTWGVSDRNFPASGGFHIDMLKTHRVRGDDSYRWRGFLEKPRVQPVCRRDEQGVGSFGCGKQLLLAVLLLLGTDFPFSEFLPNGNVKKVQIDVNPKHLGRRTALDLGLIGDVQATLAAVLPKVS
jgi:pyruvate dehydrogenase (quinone)